jgi:hypothetical protein
MFSDILVKTVLRQNGKSDRPKTNAVVIVMTFPKKYVLKFVLFYPKKGPLGVDKVKKTTSRTCLPEKMTLVKTVLRQNGKSDRPKTNAVVLEMTFPTKYVLRVFFCRP